MTNFNLISAGLGALIALILVPLVFKLWAIVRKSDTDRMSTMEKTLEQLMRLIVKADERAINTEEKAAEALNKFADRQLTIIEGIRSELVRTNQRIDDINSNGFNRRAEDGDVRNKA